MDYWKRWAKAAVIRAFKTFFQVLAGGLSASAATLGAVDWRYVLSAATFSAIYSMVTSLAGIPEVKE